MRNQDMWSARLAKKDEFYTSLSDIQAELPMYRHLFENKSVYCNCDDVRTSAFCEFFVENFKDWKLRRLVATHVSRQDAVIMEMDGDAPAVYFRRLSDFGDFRSSECLQLLRQADIVVTNPPFSMWREYLELLMRYHKQFLILGNINAVGYRTVFPFIRDNQLWLGHSIHSGDRCFYVPDDYPLEAAGCGIDENGRRFIRVKGVRWFTNLEYFGRHSPLTLSALYSAELYPKYDNYDAINVNKVKDIPCDYFGVMGVPITFVDKYCPEQFEIVGWSRHNDADMDGGLWIPGTPADALLNGRVVYRRLLIRRR